MGYVRRKHVLDQKLFTDVLNTPGLNRKESRSCGNTLVLHRE